MASNIRCYNKGMIEEKQRSHAAAGSVTQMHARLRVLNIPSRRRYTVDTPNFRVNTKPPGQAVAREAHVDDPWEKHDIRRTGTIYYNDRDTKQNIRGRLRRREAKMKDKFGITAETYRIGEAKRPGPL